MVVSVRNVKDHMREKHRRFHSKMFGDPRPFSCHSCGATFDNEKTKSNHMCTNVDFPVNKVVRFGNPYLQLLKHLV